MVLCPTPPLDDDADDALVDEWITKARAAVYERLRKSAGADIESHVIHERVIDPREWRDGLGLRRGSVFGLAHGLDQLALFRPSRVRAASTVSHSTARRRGRGTADSCSRRRGSSVMSRRGAPGFLRMT